MLKEIVFRGFESTPRIENALRHAVKRVERQVSRFDPESSYLRVVLTASGNRVRHKASVRLSIRGATLNASEENANPITATKQAFADLDGQIKRHISQTRREHLRDRMERPAAMLAEQLAAQAAREVKALEVLDAEQIDRLQRFVHREVHYRRLEGRLFGISPDSIVDDTVVLALEEADEKPPRMAYQAWLLKLARRALDQRLAGTPIANGHDDAHVEAAAYGSGLLEEPTEEDWLTFFQPDDNPSVGDITRDAKAVSPEDSMARRELHSHVHRILGQLPESWRHAFTLYTIDGFDAAAVASSLDITQKNVRHHIEQATEFLREKLKDTGYSRTE
jgi:DNA-directed RNA polymerase specialized sigma24 family protein/ribosome-associated translation inhibitor RaiA